jgi:hypothetical protein
MGKQVFKTIYTLAICGFFLCLNACSDKTSQEPPSTPKAINQTDSTQSSNSQAKPHAPMPSAELSLPADSGSKCDALLTAKCTECHSTARICEKLGKKSNSRWQRTIDRMTQRGAKLNAEEAATLLACLDDGAKDLQATCH